MPSDPSDNRTDSQTIHDFGAQWTRYSDNTGYYGSVELLEDLLGPLVALDTLPGKHVAEVGSGTGRIVRMMISAGVADVVAVEPSDAVAVLSENTAEVREQVDVVHGPGESLPGTNRYDLVVSIGVLHHVTNPRPIVRRMFEATKPGGQVFVWLYGREGNELYLRISQPLRKITRRMPDLLLAGVCLVLNCVLAVYILLSSWLPLPMHKYMRNHLGKLSRKDRYLTIFDQLNPAYAMYYDQSEALELLESSGFSDVKTHHRHGYSWSVLGTKP